MTPGEHEPLRIALLHHSYRSTGSRAVRELAGALREAGHGAYVLTSHRGWTRRIVDDGVPVLCTVRPPESRLRRRGFAGPLMHVPASVAALVAGGFDIAHAFSPPDALTALTWRRLAGRPVVFTCAGTLNRDRLAHRRRALWLLRRAVEETDAVVAATEESRTALSRWLAVDAAVIESRDASRHERLYREVLDRRR